MWAQLRAQDIRTSKESVRRVHARARPAGAATRRPAKGPASTRSGRSPPSDQTRWWGSDLTTTVTTRRRHSYGLRGCRPLQLGSSAFMQRPRGESVSRPWSRSTRESIEHFGGGDKGIAGGLQLRHDHGSAYMSRPLPGTDRLPGHRVVAQLRAFPGAAIG